MTSAQGQGSSRRKGKEITSDDPTTKNVGEDTLHSKLEHSDEEEGRRNPYSECAPFIDPWYDTYAHSPKVPGEYLPSPLVREWLSISHRNTKVSWAPLASSILELVIHQGTSLPMHILFEFGLGTSFGSKE